jgi:bacteriorhodopsin
MVTLYQENLDGNGRVILWITFGLMTASAIGFTILGARKPMELRSHAFVSVGICSIAAAAYYALATNSGYASVPVAPGSSVTRSTFYARYIDWFFTTPLLLLDVLLIAGTSFGTTLWIMFADIAMIILGLFGAVTVGKYKWGWFGAACAFQLAITYGLLVPGLQSARRRSPTLVKFYGGFSAYLAILWFGYPIVWGLAEGSNTITSDAEAASYAGLDIMAKVVFGWAIMFSTGALHRVQHEEEKRTGVAVSPLTTPINDLWGGATATSSAVPPATAHQRNGTEATTESAV